MAVLVVSFGVLMGGYCVAVWAEDFPGARSLRWLAIGCGLLLIIDCLLLLAALGIEQLVRTQDPRTATPASDDLADTRVRND
jgi:hypothetical protein